MTYKITNISIFILIVGGLLIGSVSGDEYFMGQTSKDLFENILKNDPTNFIVNYHLGLIYYNEAQPEKTINAWETYLAHAPQDAKSASIAERLVGVKIQAAENYAKKIVTQDPKSLASRIKSNSVAVLDFVTSDDPNLRILSKGLTAMLITDLAKVPQLDVVEREKMQAIIKEVGMSTSALVDDKSALRTGQFLMAKRIVRGHLKQSKTDELELTSKITDTILAKDLAEAKSAGLKSEIFKMEKKLVYQILENIGIQKSDLDTSVIEEIEHYHTSNFDAFVSYGKGIDYLDQKQYTKARQSFQKAAKMDPRFGMAKNAANKTPKRNPPKHPRKHPPIFLDMEVGAKPPPPKQNRPQGPKPPKKPLNFLLNPPKNPAPQNQYLDVAQQNNTNQVIERAVVEFNW